MEYVDGIGRLEGLRVRPVEREPLQIKSLADIAWPPTVEGRLEEAEDQVAKLTSLLWDAVYGADWSRGHCCRCGKEMVRLVPTPYFNSGTTRIPLACPDAVLYRDTGHQWILVSAPEHQVRYPGCCDPEFEIQP